MRSIPITTLTLVLLLAPLPALGAGFSIYEQSSRALGGGGALTAGVDDASAIYFNPAGLALLEKGEFYAGTSLIYVTREFAGAGPFPGYGVTESSPDGKFFPTTLYWGHRVNPDFAVGFGVYSPFGLATEWENPDQFSGRFISTRAAITPFYFNPAVAMRVSDRIRVGAGLMAVHSSVELSRHLAQPNPVDVGPDVLDLGTVKLEGNNGLDFGFNFGIQMDVTDAVTLGANYRSEVNVLYEGDADFTFIGTNSPLDPQLQPLFPKDQTAETEFAFPTLFVTALRVAPTATLAIEADLGWTQWSSFGVLPLRFADPELSTEVEEDWEDTFFLRLGAEIDINDDTQLRLGYYFDETPQLTEVISPLLPDNDRHGLSAGLGKTWDRWRADVFGLVLLSKERSTDGTSRDQYEGVYSNGAVITGLSFGYRY